jgi:23S rRNA pseudouridine1911/1915/1917 synthase
MKNFEDEDVAGAWPQETDADELFEHHKFIADPGQELLRIDKFLIDRIPNTSRNKIQESARAGNILVNGNAVKNNYKIRPGDEVSVVMPYPVREIELLAEDIPLDIVFEDETLLVINKVAGMVSHPGFGNFSGTLVNAVLHHLGVLPGGTDAGVRPGLVHRLDKNTSGLMVLAKTDFAMSHLARQFFDRTSSRKYHAIVWGDFETDEGTVTGNIGRSLKNRKVMSVFPDGEVGKHAVTHYKVLRRFGYVTLLECKLETGRTHQIRAHMQYIGHPLFNDPEYDGDRILSGTTFTKYRQFVENCFQVCPRHALHAKTLGFNHPETGERMEFDSDLPKDMSLLLEKWERYVGIQAE